MATLVDAPSFTANEIVVISANDFLEGAAAGASHGGIGVDNFPHQQFANRTSYLYQQVNTKPYFCVDTSTSANSLVATIAPAPASYAAIAGTLITVLVHNTNTGPAFLNLNGLGGTLITNPDGTITQAGQLGAGLPITVVFLNSVGFVLVAGARVLEGAGVISQGIIQNNGGDIVSNAGHLRAAHGALGTGDGSIAALLGDFPLTPLGNGATQLPNGLILQWGIGAQITSPQTIGFTEPFPHVALHCFPQEASPAGWGGTAPTIMAAQDLSTTGFSLYVLKWTGAAWASVGGISYRYWAIGL